MAFSHGTASVEANEIKRYVGVAPVYVLAVNPNKAELSKLYGREIENEPEYLNKVTTGEDNHTVDNLRLDFIVKTDAEKCNVDLVTKVAFFLKNEYKYNRDKSKVQVIDIYGRTCWVTIEQAKTKEIPTYSNGQLANIDRDYRPAYVGEEELTNFLKNYMNIPNPQAYVNGSWVANPKVKAEDCYSRLDGIAEYFKGNFKEIKEIVGMQPNNKVKIMFGVRVSDDNKLYQTAYTQLTLKNNVSDYSKLDKDLQERLANGSFPNTTFIAEDIKEYSNEPTPLAANDTASPFFN